MDDGIKRRPVWILVMGAPSAAAALIAGLLAGAPAGSAVALALAFGFVLGILTFAVNRSAGDRDRRGGQGR